MKKIYFLFAFAAQLSFGVYGQTDENRSTETKIADLLARVPANDSVALGQNANEIALLGEKGLAQLLSKLSPADSGTNARVQYALGNFTFYVTQKGKEEWRKLAQAAYTEALPKLTDKTSQQFVIYELQQFAQDDAIPAIKIFLTDDTLSGPAARALAKIGSQAAGSTLVEALANSSDHVKVSLAEALGDMQFDSAATSLEALASGQNPGLRKVVLGALANIGAASSAKVLADAAKAANYAFDSTNATAAYMRYLTTLTEKGQTEPVLKACEELLNSTKGSTVHSGALMLLSQIKGNESVPELIRSVQSEDAALRASALETAMGYREPDDQRLWVKALKKAKDDVKPQILRFLGSIDAKDALPAVLKLLGSANGDVRRAAIDAAAKIGQQTALPSILPLAKTQDSADVWQIKNSLLAMKGSTVARQIAGVISSSSSLGQEALVDILGQRADTAAMKTITGLLRSTNTGVKAAAFGALSGVSSTSDLNQLYELLNSAESGSEVKAIQSAIVAVLPGLGDANAQSEAVIQKLNNAPKKQLYYPLLGAVGGENALSTVTEGFNQGDDSTKSAALGALTQWPGPEAMNELYKIAQNPPNEAAQDSAVKGYLNGIEKADLNPVKNVLMLRKILSVASTNKQKLPAIKRLSQNKTFDALLTAGAYLDDKELQQAAALAVADIAMADKDFNGPTVKGYLSKVLEILSGADSDYLKQAVIKHLGELPNGGGFVPLFNGKNLEGWKGLVGDPISRANLSADSLVIKQAKADSMMNVGWSAKNGELVFNGHGENLCTIKQYGDFEMYVDWKIEKDGDAGVYLRGTPQVQIWDTSRVDVGAQVGSGGLYNNKKNPSKPTKVADNAIGDWNTFYIKMVGDRVTVDLNGELVVDSVLLENYWDGGLPIFAREQIELQAHGTLVAYRDIYIKELPNNEPFVLSKEEEDEGYQILFDGTNLDQWTGNKEAYMIDNNELVIKPSENNSGGNLYTEKEFGDFDFRFEFMLTPGANNGLGIRAPLEGDAAYEGTELQILDNDADIYKDLKPYQFHGSAYGIIPAKKGFLKPNGEWNTQEVHVQGQKVKVILNGETILDGDLKEASKNGTPDKREHPGIERTTGHIGFLGHGSEVHFRNIRIMDLTKVPKAASEK